jgi:hypothetical protein
MLRVWGEGEQTADKMRADADGRQNAASDATRGGSGEQAGTHSQKYSLH